MPTHTELVSLTLNSYLPLEREDSSEFFLYPRFLSQTFIHNSQDSRGRGGYFFSSPLPFSLDSLTVIHQPGNQYGELRELLVSEQAQKKPRNNLFIPFQQNFSNIEKCPNIPTSLYRKIFKVYQIILNIIYERVKTFSILFGALGSDVKHFQT